MYFRLVLFELKIWNNWHCIQKMRLALLLGFFFTQFWISILLSKALKVGCLEKQSCRFNSNINFFLFVFCLYHFRYTFSVTSWGKWQQSYLAGRKSTCRWIISAGTVDNWHLGFHSTPVLDTSDLLISASSLFYLSLDKPFSRLFTEFPSVYFYCNHYLHRLFCLFHKTSGLYKFIDACWWQPFIQKLRIVYWKKIHFSVHLTRITQPFNLNG